MEPDDDKTQTHITLAQDTLIGHYRIIEKIGAGGMGEVYLAEDTKLNREVALKFLSPHLCQDEDCRKRFTREAQAAAKLDHPNVAAIYEVGEYQSRPFFSMQVVEGQSLREVIAGKDLPIDRMLEICAQVCEGLQAAHDKGIIHRDIKPSNILVDSQGRARIVDFGLASVADSDQLTKSGSTLGTIGYMSPEQVEGRDIDHRSDLFSLGVVLYELITSNNPFKRDNSAATLKAVSDDIPHPIARYRSGIPDGLQSIVDKALEKDVKRRYQHADDMQVDLRRLRADSDSRLLRGARLRKTGRKTGRSPAIWVSLIAMIIALAYISFKAFWSEQPRLVQATHQQLTFSGNVAQLAISPDGKSIAYSVWTSESVDNPSQQLFVKDIAGGRPLPIYEALRFASCQWSPDGSHLLFTEVTDSTTKGLHIIPRLGGATRDFRYWTYACWSPDGEKIAACTHNPNAIYVLDIASGEITKIDLVVDFQWLMGLEWSPTDERLLFLAINQGLSSIWTISPEGNEQNLVLEDSSVVVCAHWSSKGKTIYYLKERGHIRDLMKIHVSTSSGKATSEASVVRSGLQCGLEFSLSNDGTRLIYTRDQTTSNLWSAVRKDDRDSVQFTTYQLTEGTSLVFSPSVSPDGKRVAFSMGNFEKTDIHTVPIEGGQINQLTFLDGFSDCPAWSPDGREIAFASKHDNKHRIWRVNSSGGTPRPFTNTKAAFERRPDLSWSPCDDILYLRPGNANFHLLNPETEEESPLLASDTLGWIFDPACSPDGRQVAVFWNRRGSGTSIWILSLKDSLQSHLMNTGHLHVIGWLPGGERICVCEGATGTYLQRGFSPAIMTVTSNGDEPEPYVTLPFDKLYEKISMSSDGKSFAFVIAESQSDIWLMENFDPDVN